jgi:hypothetical protein
MAQNPIPSSSLEFKTREYYIENTNPDTAKGATLTFQELDKTLLFLSQSITSGSSGTYSSSFSGSGVTTVDTVGGITYGTSINDLQGKTFSALFDDIFFPTINPTANPGSLVSTTSRTYEEIGATINVTVDSTFTQGTWTVIGQSNRDYYGLPTTYYYSSSTDVEFPYGINTSYIFSSYIVTPETNNFPTAVSYSMGDQPVNSKGASYGSPISAGKLTDSDVSFTGIYPWFYGSSSAANFSVSDIVTAIQSLYSVSPSTNTVKSVTLSTSTITARYLNYQTSTPMWCWFAIPSTSTSKTKWYETAVSNGDIGGTGTNPFNAFSSQNINLYINGVSYKIYAGGYKTAYSNNTGYVELRNS